MASKAQQFSIDNKAVDRLLKIIIKNNDVKKIDIDIKQFLIDVIMRNYKISKKNTGILIGSTAVLIVPTEVLTSIIFGRIAFIIDKSLGFFDEAFFAAKIISVIVDESKSYCKFVESDDYVPAVLSSNQLVKVDPKQIITLVKDSIEKLKSDSSDNLSKDDKYEISLFEECLSIVDIVEYTTDNYKAAAIKYIETNQTEKKDYFVKLDSNKVKKSSIVEEAFDIDKFQNIVQSEMKEELESSTTKLGTYRLARNFSTNQNQMTRSYETFIFKTTKLYKLLGTEISIGLLDYIAEEINKVGTNIENMVFVMDNMLIEVSIVDNYNIQAISNKVEYINIAEQVQANLTNNIKHNKSLLGNKFKTKVLNFKVNDNLIELQVKLALEKVYAVSQTDKTIKLSHDTFLQFIPMYNKQDKMRYLRCIQDKFDTSTVGEKYITIEVQQDYDLTKELDKFTISKKNNFILLTTKLNGNLDIEHVINLFHRLFLIQLYSTDSDLIKLVVNVDCSNGVIIQAKQYDKYSVSVIDATAKLGNDIELQVETLLKNEIKSNMQLFKLFN